MAVIDQTSFYKDSTGQSPFREHGFTHAWADQAGKLALLEAEKPHEDNVVTFATLSLFWYTQGSWRRSYIHKGTRSESQAPTPPIFQSSHLTINLYIILGNAMQTAHLLNLSSQTKAKDNSLETEISRRRWWACYLINCHSSESMFTISSPQKIATLPLPWSDVDFDRGQSDNPPVFLDSSGSNGGIYCELIRGMTHW